ncbi:MAG: hypothetical protein WAK10_04625 [Methanoregula sp.]
MKIITLFTLFIAVGCILATGCVAQPKKDPGNTTVSPTTTFAPFVNTTTVPGTNVTNTTNISVNNTSGLSGPLRVSISSYNAGLPLPVIIDNKTVGNVTREQPLDVTLFEGNHTVQVCVGVICPSQFVEIQFAKRSYLDFGDRLRQEAEFSVPTVRLLDYFKNGNGVGVNVEFINPTQKDLAMVAEVGCGYTYIDGRTSLRMGDSVRSKSTAWVEAGRHVTQTVNLYFTYGSAYTFDEPTITDVSYQ